MAKKINGPNGEQLIVSEDVDLEDLNYDQDAFDIHLATEILKKQNKQTLKNTMVNPFSLLLLFDNSSYPKIPINLKRFEKTTEGFDLKGSMLASDFAWLIEEDIKVINQLEFSLEQRSYDIGNGSWEIKRMKAKDMNAVAVVVNLSLVKTI